MPLIFTLTVANQFRYPVWGQEASCLMHRHRRLLTQKRIFSPAHYFKVGTSGNSVKCYIISAVLWLDYLQSSLFISIAKEASQFQYTFWENHDLTVQPAITYVYLCRQIMHPVYLIFHTFIL
jgi:hypothetical protein